MQTDRIVHRNVATKTRVTVPPKVRPPHVSSAGSTVVKPTPPPLVRIHPDNDPFETETYSREFHTNCSLSDELDLGKLLHVSPKNRKNPGLLIQVLF